MVLEEVSVEMMTDPAQIWMECKSALFRSTSIFLSQSSDPQRHLADDMRHYSSCLSRILLENQGAQSTCRRVLHYFQQIFNIYAIIFEHGPENLIVRPQMDKHTFGHRLVEDNDRNGYFTRNYGTENRHVTSLYFYVVALSKSIQVNKTIFAAIKL